MLEIFLKRQLFILLVFATLGSVGQTPNQDSTELPPPPPPKDIGSKSNTKIWQSDEYKIKLSVPSTWKAITPNEGELVSFVSPSRQMFALRAYHLVFPGTANEIRQRLESGYKTQCPKCKIDSSRVITIGELEMCDVTIQGTIGTSTGLYRSISFHNDINSIIITCFYQPIDRAKFEKILTPILKSITFY